MVKIITKTILDVRQIDVKNKLGFDGIEILFRPENIVNNSKRVIKYLKSLITHFKVINLEVGDRLINKEVNSIAVDPLSSTKEIRAKSRAYIKQVLDISVELDRFLQQKSLVTVHCVADVQCISYNEKAVQKNKSDLINELNGYLTELEKEYSDKILLENIFGGYISYDKNNHRKDLVVCPNIGMLVSDFRRFKNKMVFDTAHLAVNLYVYKEMVKNGLLRTDFGDLIPSMNSEERKMGNAVLNTSITDVFLSELKKIEKDKIMHVHLSNAQGFGPYCDGFMLSEGMINFKKVLPNIMRLDVPIIPEIRKRDDEDR